jgi:hypothetical protein
VVDRSEVNIEPGKVLSIIHWFFRPDPSRCLFAKSASVGELISALENSNVKNRVDVYYEE